MSLTGAAQSVWAKSRRDDDTWLPLYQHLTDSAAVAGYLWDEWLPRSVRAQVGECLPGGLADARVLTTWLAGVHDIGKATPSFALQAQHLTGRMRDEGLDVPVQMHDTRLLKHAGAGQHLLTRWLVDRYGFDRRTATTFAVVVGGHHGSPPDHDPRLLVEEFPYLVGDGLWHDIQDELLDHMAAITTAKKQLPNWCGVRLTPMVQVLLTGVVIVADWLASDDERFPYADSRGNAERSVDAWNRLALPPPWSPEPPPDLEALFTDRFSLRDGPRPVQVLAVQMASEAIVPPMLVIEAPMGVGKTEAALAAAEVLAASFGSGGVFVALPTMATSDAMFHRVRAWVDSLPASTEGATGTVFLAHGKSRLNEEFDGLAQARHLRGIGQDESSRPVSATASTGPTLLAVAHSWLAGRKKGPLASFVVGTIDQVLFAGLKHRHVALRHLALSNKVVIVDEVHAADEFMRVYLTRVLEWFGAYGVPTIVLSATLPAMQRRQLVEAYESGRRAGAAQTAPAPDYGVLDGDIGYPAVIAATGGAPEVRTVTTTAEPIAVHLKRLDDDDETLVRALSIALADGGCAAVVRNTVNRAQATTDLLRRRCPDTDVVLLHSRFVATDRIERETMLRHKLGPPDVVSAAGCQRPGRFIVVGTQVIEQSLDVDFDLLIADLAPVDLLLQRIGRLHRHVRADRPIGVHEAQCLITGIEDWSAQPPEPVAGSVKVYGRSRLLRAAAVLEPVWTTGVLSLPAGIPALVQAAYAREVTTPTGWESALAAADDEAARVRTARVQNAEVFLLKHPDCPPNGSLVGWLRSGSGEVNDDGGAGQAQVRDGEDSIEAIVVQRIDDEVRLLPWTTAHQGRLIETEHGTPPADVARAVAACTIRLPGYLSKGASGDRVVNALEENWFAGWQKSPWLAGQLVLVLDAELSAHIGRYQLRYDRDRGLLVTKEGTT